MNDDEAPNDRADEPSEASEPEPPPTVYEQMLVREEAGNVVAEQARKVLNKFPLVVHDRGVMDLGDLHAIGQVALYRAARAYDDKLNPDFAAFARYYVRGAMLNAIDAVLFEDRVTRAVAIAEDNHLAYHRGDDYNVMKHDAAEARRRYRAFANGEVAATFIAALEEAEKHLDLAELDERREYEYAVATLRNALARLAQADQKLLAVAYRDLQNLKEAAESLGLPYGTARAHHARALRVLRELLGDAGISRVPRPLVVPDVAAFDAGAARAPPQNDTRPDENKPKGSKGPGESM